MSVDELVEIIDDQGQILEIVPKKEAHTRGLLHKTVLSEIIDSQGRWLLAKQSADRQDAGQYVSPIGGHVSAGESNEQALEREAWEEMGLKAGFRYVYRGSAVYNREVIGRKENHLFVYYTTYTDQTPVLNHEAESCRYFTEEELKTLLRNQPDMFGGSFHFVVHTFYPRLLGL